MSSFVFLALILLGSVVFVSHSQTKHHPVVHCETTKGPLTIEVYPEWAPIGAERFLALVADEFYTNIALFRCVDQFLVQFGISDNPIKKHWHGDNIPDDPNLHLGIKKHYLSFAGGGANTRSTQLFIAFEYLDFLGKEPWETPFGKVIEGGDTLDRLYKGYGDIPPFGEGPDQQMIYSQGNSYIRAQYPQTDFILSCSLVDEEPLAALAEMEQNKGSEGFVPEDDDDEKEKYDGSAEVEPRVSNRDSASIQIATDLPLLQAHDALSRKDHGNLREEIAFVEHEVETLIQRNEVVAWRALLVLCVALVGFVLYNKIYLSSAATLSGKRQ